MKTRNLTHTLITLMTVLGLGLSACGPTYPKCYEDAHCVTQGQFCLNGICQQCATDSHCASQGFGQACAGGKCESVFGYCSETVSCPSPQKCRNHRCGPECLDNSDCLSGEYCSDGRTCSRKPKCGEGAEVMVCPEGKRCIDGTCQVKITQCGGEPIYFEFDRSTIDAKEKNKLSVIAQCLKGLYVASVVLQGHSDERGTEEYTMALGERRARATKKYLNRLGVADDKLSITSYGKNRPAVDQSNERAWSRNRRTEFVFD